VIELYAITDHPGPPLPPGLRAVEDDGLALVCAESDEPREPSVDLLWQHEDVVEALMEGRDVLPVRYGTRLDGDAAAVRILRERRGQLASALERVRGAVELSVRVLGDQQEQPARGEHESGTDYMRAKAGIAAAENAAIDAIHQPLVSLAREGVRRPPSAPGELLRAAYLVDRDRVTDFTRLVAELEARHPDLRLLCTGPWPPYSFSE
jgi:Gas vesicle synthesis protein GvpL/GvpF